MYKAFGIVSSSGRNIYVDGMQDYRPIGAFSFLGRYRVIDFPISNMTNSNIERIQVYINNKPRSVVEHLDVFEEGYLSEDLAGLCDPKELKEMPENRRMMQLIRARLETLLSRLSFPHEVAYTREAGDAQRLAATAVRAGGRCASTPAAGTAPSTRWSTGRRATIFWQ